MIDESFTVVVEVASFVGNPVLDFNTGVLDWSIELLDLNTEVLD